MQLAGDQAAVEAANSGMKEVEVKIKNIQLDVQTRQTLDQAPARPAVRDAQERRVRRARP
jgi:hypothetical protein